MPESAELAIRPPTADVDRGQQTQSPLRAIRDRPGTQAGAFVASRYRVPPKLADLVANLAGLGAGPDQ